MAKAPKLGEILVQLGYLTPERLGAALMHQRQWGVSLGRAAVAKNFCTEAQVLEALSRQLGLPPIALDDEELNPVLAAMLSQKDAEKHHTVPIRVSGARGEVLVVAMSAPASMASQDAVLGLTKKSRLQIFLATDEAVHRAIGRVYRGENFVPITDEALLGNREQMLDPEALQGSAQTATSPGGGADEFAGLSLSSDCKQVLRYGAEVRKASARSIIEQVLEDWASRQRAAWAKNARR